MESFRTREQEIRKALIQTIENAMSLEEYQAIQEKRTPLTPEEVREKTKASTLTVHTLPEFRAVLEMVYEDPQTVTHVLEHENAHANMSQVVGANFEGYSIVVLKSGDQLLYGASAGFSHPTEWLHGDKINDVIRVFNAPAEYGNELSESDARKIDELKKSII